LIIDFCPSIINSYMLLRHVIVVVHAQQSDRVVPRGFGIFCILLTFGVF
jgi:hypothetical protein